MGCSAGVIAVGLAQRLLAGEPNSRALVVSTENITLNWYSGNERSMLIPNTLFRMGGAGVLLTNRASDRWTAKYSLEHIVRVHLGRDDSAYRCDAAKHSLILAPASAAYTDVYLHLHIHMYLN